MSIYGEDCVICGRCIYNPIFGFYRAPFICPDALRQFEFIDSKVLEKAKKTGAHSIKIKDYWERRIKNGSAAGIKWHNPNQFHGGFVICGQCAKKNKMKCPVCGKKLKPKYDFRKGKRGKRLRGLLKQLNLKAS